MIVALFTWFGAQASRWAIYAAVGSTLLFGAYIKGRSDYKEVCRLAAATETIRQATVNNIALRKANERADALQLQMNALQDELQKVQDEANKDPRAVIDGIGADSVRRIDRIQ